MHDIDTEHLVHAGLSLTSEHPLLIALLHTFVYCIVLHVQAATSKHCWHLTKAALAALDISQDHVASAA